MAAVAKLANRLLKNANIGRFQAFYFNRFLSSEAQNEDVKVKYLDGENEGKTLYFS
jgi:hypothetical protein